MPRDLRILNEDPWFLSEEQGYPIFYRYVICYSLLYYLNEKKHTREEGLTILKKLSVAIDNKRMLREVDFLELFPFKDDEGFVVIDQSNGIYPLTIYSEEIAREGRKERVYAFQKSVEDVINNYDKICEKLNNVTFPTGWTEDFQNSLRPLFTTVQYEK